MIIDRPEWVAHRHPEGISAIDIHPNGRRLVTCGTDPQIKVWNLLPILDPEAEADSKVPKLLATLSEHQGSVLVVAFNHSGRLLASGGNDNAVLLYKLLSTPATSKLGAAFVNIENWRAVGSIRRHSLDVTGLAWSPNDKQLATCSMDGSILIHNITPEGDHSPAHQILRQHNGWVKGVVFDPLGRYLASQGRNGVKVWDAQADWQQVMHQKAPFEKSPEAAFKLRISWSPDGEELLAANAFSGGKPTTVLFKRQSWDSTFMVGHMASVVAAVANPRLFYPPLARLADRRKIAAKLQREAEGLDSEDGDEAAAVDGGSADVSGFDDSPSMVLACGSNDKTLTVWLSELSIPLLHLTQVHTGPVVDFVWTPDGYTLIAASSDDSISVLRFSEAELGKALTDEQLKAVLTDAYGEATLAGNAGAAAAPAILDTDLLDLAAGPAEAAAAPAITNGMAPAPAAPAQITAAALPAAAAAAAAPAARRVAPQPVGQVSTTLVNGISSAGGVDALARRIMPTGAGVTTGTLQHPTTAAAGASTAAASRKRVHPSGAGAAAAAPSSKRLAVGQQQQQQPQQLAVRQQSARAAAAAAAGSSGWLLQCPPVLSKLEVQIGHLSVATSQGLRQQQVAVVMTVENHSSRGSSNAAGGVAIADVKVHALGLSGPAVWQDKVQGEVTCIAGSPYFSAAVTSTGLLHTWRSGGNMLLPPMALGSPIVRMEAQGDWGLQLVGADGHFMLLDFMQCQRQLEPAPAANIGAVLALSPGTNIADAWITGTTKQQQQQHCIQQTHVAVLSDTSAWMFHIGLGCWMNLQPGVRDLAAAAPHPGQVALTGDAERLRQASSNAAASCGVNSRPPLPIEAQSVWKRKEAELALWRATFLGDAAAYERWLYLLIRLLVDQRDMGRLKELAMDLLGPPRWTPGMASYSDWQPTILGLNKRQLLQKWLVPPAAQAQLDIALAINKELQAAQEHVANYECMRAQATAGGFGSGQQKAAGAAAGGHARISAPGAALRLQPTMQQQEQQRQLGMQEQQRPRTASVVRPDAPAAAAGSGTGVASGKPRRIAPTAVQQQGNGVNAAAAGQAEATAGRPPLQETQQANGQQQQHGAGQQQQQEKVCLPVGNGAQVANDEGV